MFKCLSIIFTLAFVFSTSSFADDLVQLHCDSGDSTFAVECPASVADTPGYTCRYVVELRRYRRRWYVREILMGSTVVGGVNNRLQFHDYPVTTISNEVGVIVANRQQDLSLDFRGGYQGQYTADYSRAGVVQVNSMSCVQLRR